MSEVVSSGEFTDALTQQGAALSFGLRTDEWRHTRFGQEKVWSPSVVDGIDLAGAQLRKYPDEPLVEPPLPIDIARLPRDHLAQALGRMINASIIPVDKRPTDDMPSFVSVGARWDACAEAEPGFLWSSMAIGNFNLFGPKKTNNLPGSAKIITDGNGVPIFMQKAHNLPSVLTLREIAIDGVPYPVGSIVALSYDERADESVRLGKLRFMNSVTINGVDFLRLSSFTVPPDQRPQYDPEYYKLTPHESKVIKDLTLDRIVNTAARAVRLVKAGVGGSSSGVSESVVDRL